MHRLEVDEGSPERLHHGDRRGARKVAQRIARDAELDRKVGRQHSAFDVFGDSGFRSPRYTEGGAGNDNRTGLNEPAAGQSLVSH